MAKTSKRVGPKMAVVVSLANRPGGIARIDAAGHVSPHGSLRYGYQTVNRTLRAKFVIAGTHQGSQSGRRGMLLTTLD